MGTPKVVVFLATYNGQKFLAQQLDSLKAQSHTNWELWVSDDGSKDNTLALLEGHQKSCTLNSCFIHQGPGKGFAQNFLSLVCKPQAIAQYYAYCDQDDYWHKDKLKKALAWLETSDPAKPALYCSRTKLIDEQNKGLGYSPKYKKGPGFANAMVQNIAAGNTIVLNHAAVELLRKAGDEVVVPAHDWWTYLLVSGAGGSVFFDVHPTIDYRQHGLNVLGANTGWMARMHRIKRLFRGDFQRWNDQNVKALCSVLPLLTGENQKLLKEFALMRKEKWLRRCLKTKKMGLYRQTLLGNLGLAVAAVFNKL
jgi:glycosyltransferase involved in cell wall biosynthesis